MEYLKQAPNRDRQFALFTKSLIAFLIIKIIFLWSTLNQIVEFSPPAFSPLSRIAYLPVQLAMANLDFFLIGSIAVLFISLFLRLNFYYLALIFWLSMSISKLAIPVATGSDLILNLYLFLAAGYSVSFLFKKVEGESPRSLIANFFFIFSQVQLTVIYFLSGFDKLMSRSWRSGDAIYSISNLDFFMNPVVGPLTGKPGMALLAWTVILFELGFAFLIWFRRLRIALLVCGLIFHLGIIFFLSLPDFGMVMILTYILFLPRAFLKAASVNS